jgi:hypothetical protein
LIESKYRPETTDLQDMSYDRADVIRLMQEKGKTFGICKLIEIKDAVFFTLFVNSALYGVFNSGHETRVFERLVDDMVYAGNQFTINNMVCSDENGVYAVGYPQLLADYTGRHINDILKDDIDKRDLLVSLPEDANPVIFYYNYIEKAK